MSLSELATKNRLAGVSSVLRKLRKRQVIKVFIAEDADAEIKKNIMKEASEFNVSVEMAESMLQLGRACAIARKTAVAAILKEEDRLD